MTAELIYRTSSPAAATWYSARNAEQVEQSGRRNAFQDEMLATYGPADVPEGRQGHGLRNLMVTRRGVVGIHSGWQEAPPADSGWRLDARDRFWKPSLRSAKGRALAKRLEELTVVDLNRLSDIGIPEVVFAGLHMYSPGLDHDDAPFALYQIWGSGECEQGCLAEQAKHPDVVWVEVLRSEWYARIEAKTAATAAA